MVRRERSLQGQARKIAQEYSGKHIYAKLKIAAQENQAKLETQKKFGKAISNITKYWLRKGFASMKIGKKHATQEEFTNYMGEQNAILEQEMSSLDSLNGVKENINEKEINRRRLMKIFMGWRLQSRFQDLIKKKAELLNNSLRLIRIGGSFSRWREDFYYLQSHAEKYAKAVQHHENSLINKGFKGLYKNYLSDTILPKVLSVIAKRQYANNIAYALEKLMAAVSQKNKSIKDNLEIGKYKLSSLIIKAFSQRFGGILNTLTKNLEDIKLDKQLLRRVLLRNLRFSSC